MNLTQGDLQEIRSIVQAAAEPLSNEIQALRNDIKEIFDMTTD